jgi:hypothetical protein
LYRPARRSSGVGHKGGIIVILGFRFVVVLYGVGATLAAAWTTPVNLGPTVNSASLDASPSLGEYGGTTYLFFSSNRPGGLGSTDIWYATGTPPDFGAPVHMGDTVNSADHDGGPGIFWTGGPTADTLYFYSTRPGGAGASDIYETTYSGGVWSASAGVAGDVNTGSAEYYASIAPWLGETRMYFARETHLYYSVYDGGSWGPGILVSLGAGDAYHPCLRGEGEGAKLYFSSTRAGGYGDYDIWVSTYEGGEWGTPVNLGPTVNTAYADNCPWFAPDGETMYFSSTRPGGEGYYDIWYTVMDDVAVEADSLGRVKASFR